MLMKSIFTGWQGAQIIICRFKAIIKKNSKCGGKGFINLQDIISLKNIYVTFSYPARSFAKIDERSGRAFFCALISQISNIQTGHNWKSTFIYKLVPRAGHDTTHTQELLHSFSVVLSITSLAYLRLRILIKHIFPCMIQLCAGLPNPNKSQFDIFHF